MGEWISVKDKLPEKYGNYLTCDAKRAKQKKSSRDMRERFWREVAT